MNLFDIEAQLFALADELRKENEKAARKIVAAIAALRTWQKQDEEEWYTRHAEQLHKWNEFMNATLKEEFDHQHKKAEQERARILHALAIDPRWEGSYADLVKVVKE